MKASSCVAPPRRLYDENADTSDEDEQDDLFQPIDETGGDSDDDSDLLRMKPDRKDTSAVMRRAAAVRKKYQKRVAQRAAEARRKKRDAAMRKNSGLFGGPASAAAAMAKKAAATAGGGRGSPSLSVDTETGPVPGVPSTKQARYLEQAFSLSMKPVQILQSPCAYYGIDAHACLCIAYRYASAGTCTGQKSGRPSSKGPASATAS